MSDYLQKTAAMADAYLMCLQSDPSFIGELCSGPHWLDDLETLIADLNSCDDATRLRAEQTRREMENCATAFELGRGSFN